MSRQERQRPTLIELQDKVFKRAKVLAGGFAITAIAAGLVMSDEHGVTDAGEMALWVLGGLSIFTYGVASFAAWWNHG